MKHEHKRSTVATRNGDPVRVTTHHPVGAPTGAVEAAHAAGEEIARTAPGSAEMEVLMVPVPRADAAPRRRAASEPVGGLTPEQCRAQRQFHWPDQHGRCVYCGSAQAVQ